MNDTELCRLSSLSSLEKLDLSRNRFTDGLLPLAVYELVKLRELTLDNCGLTTLDERLVDDSI